MKKRKKERKCFNVQIVGPFEPLCNGRAVLIWQALEVGLDNAAQGTLSKSESFSLYSLILPPLRKLFDKQSNKEKVYK